ncbi:CCA tRNA nucleotidyltransferase [Szabonella alba]|uniref:CCA tRNA nucleotidyltransferase n=1 Tax=Szabonella alba TaxID=2804194 RepID=A0A8K0V7G8_9RHOB|nr:CCA tRNA nucleotidyltransferase [Szabonella alba]MBL4916882.1 CCA tRNA nucleotidyltransferase [Szabonella alba]
MKITADWLTDPRSQALCLALEGAGHVALFVGGCVRNSLLGARVTDLDLTTDARPEQVIAIADAAGFRCVPTGIDHGTVTVIVKGLVHEVTTFRRDVETDGRHARVAFTASVAEDAARRDFTMNALYADREGCVIDPLGGLADLTQRRLRFVGDPAARIAEDYLRILRFFRFHAWYGDPDAGLDPEGLAACAAGLDGIARLSRERIGAEMRKLLSAPDPAPAVASMAASGVLAAVLPGADPTALPILVHGETKYPRDWIVRLASLGPTEAQDALRLSRAEARHLDILRTEVGGTRRAGELAYRLGPTIALDVIVLREAMLQIKEPLGWQDDLFYGATARFPLRAADLMPRFTGPALGAALKEREDRWIASGFRLDRAALMQ